MVRASRLGCAAERTEENVTQWLEKFKSVLLDVAFHSNDMDYMDGVSGEFVHLEPRSADMITENCLRINIGITFNESWFMKLRVR